MAYIQGKINNTKMKFCKITTPSLEVVVHTNVADITAHSLSRARFLLTSIKDLSGYVKAAHIKIWGNAAELLGEHTQRIVQKEKHYLRRL